MRAMRMGVADTMRDTEELPVIIARKPSSNERARTFASFHHEHGICKADHEPIATGEIIFASLMVRRVLGQQEAP